MKSKGFSIGKDSIYKMMEDIFAIYMLASVERYDPAVIRREMSNKKVYLYDNGFAAALHYSFSEDVGKRLENFVFRHLLEQTDDIYFARNGWECDFIVVRPGCVTELIQVTQRLDQENIDRELKGLISGRQRVGSADGLLLVGSAAEGLDIPSWIRVLPVQEWAMGSS